MALTTSTITGRVPLPNDLVPYRGRVHFGLSGSDTQGADVVAPGIVTARLASDGSLPSGFRLWRNTSGTQGTVYRVVAEWDVIGCGSPHTVDLGYIQIGTASTYTLASLLGSGVGPAQGIYQNLPSAEWQAILNRVSVIETDKWVTPTRLSDAVLAMFGGQGYSGVWSPAGNFPGGSGVVAGQTWIVTAAGSRGGQAFTVGDRLVAITNNPSTTVYAGNWIRIQEREVTTSNYDNTSGRIMKVSDFGVGGSAVQAGDAANDLNAVSGGGTQFVRADGSTLNKPTRTGNWVGLHIQRTAEIAVQLLVSRAGSPMIATRRVDTGVWTDWLYHYNSENILGTVGQASGVPTGAIIERGSNANGEYTKFADGTMICRASGTGLPAAENPVGSVFSGSELEWTFPMAFASAPACFGGHRSPSAGWVSCRPKSATVGALRWITPTSSTSASSYDAVAIGRWF